MTDVNVTTPVDNPASGNPSAEWLIMIYQAGDNNLANDCIRALTELKKIGSANPDLIHVIAQCDPRDVRMPTRRFVINRGNKSASTSSASSPLPLEPSPNPRGLESDDVAVVPGTVRYTDMPRRDPLRSPPAVLETNSADPETLFDFISWRCQNYRAKRRMLILSGHAAGVEDGYLLKDENPPNSMIFPGLCDVFKAVRDRLNVQLDIIGMDACLMSMIEICYELRNEAKILISSQSLIPNPGWPMGEVLTALEEAKGQMEAEQLAPVIVEKYINFYLEDSIISGLSVDLAAIKLDATEKVVEEISRLAEALERELDKTAFLDAIILSHWEAQSYGGELFLDLVDFCELLKKRYTNGEIPSLCDGIQRTISESMVIKSCFSGIDYQYSNGVSIYFPWSTIFEGYKNFGFAADDVSGWNKFLTAYLEKTCRAPRLPKNSSTTPDVDSSSVKLVSVFSNTSPFTRRDPPHGHGPSDVIHSMRNPPRRVSREAVDDCIKDKGRYTQLVDIFKIF